MSTCMVDKKTILEACDNAKQYVPRHRRNEWLSAVRREMKPHKHFFFWEKTLTFKEAIKEAKYRASSNWFNPWINDYRKTLEIADAITKVCNICLCEEVNLDFEHGEFIARWIDVKPVKWKSRLEK